jgi:hypothetical protein
LKLDLPLDKRDFPESLIIQGSPKGQSLYHCANARGKGGGIFARNGQGMNGGGYDAA